MYEDLVDSEESAERRWLTIKIVREAVEAAFILNRWRAVKPKHLMEELKRQDPRLFEMVIVCLGPDALTPAIERLCLDVLEPAGGWLR